MEFKNGLYLSKSKEIIYVVTQPNSNKITIHPVDTTKKITPKRLAEEYNPISNFYLLGFLKTANQQGITSMGINLKKILSSLPNPFKKDLIEIIRDCDPKLGNLVFEDWLNKRDMEINILRYYGYEFTLN